MISRRVVLSCPAKIHLILKLNIECQKLNEARIQLHPIRVIVHGGITSQIEDARPDAPCPARVMASPNTFPENQGCLMEPKPVDLHAREEVVAFAAKGAPLAGEVGYDFAD